MVALTFDTLSSANYLKSQGFTPEQAEAVVKTVRSVQESNLDDFASKADLKEMDSDIRGEIRTLRSEMREMELRITNRLGAMIIALGGILIAIKYFG